MSEQEKNGYVYVPNSRGDEQRDVMEKIVRDKVCPFCMEHLAKYHKKPILRESEHWILTENQWPYEHTRRHLLAITKTHVESMDELPAGAGEELFDLFRWAVRELDIRGGGFSVRFGDHEHSGGSVTHLHAQLVEPNLDDPTYEPVRIKIGKSAPKKGA